MAKRMGRLLVVDDEENILRAYERMLSGVGHTVRTAPDGDTAARLVSSESFDAIISDVAMPRMTGVQFLKKVRERDLDVPVILSTGAPSLESATQAVQYGAFRYLLKPVPREILLETIEEALQMHDMARLRRQAAELVGSLALHVHDRAGLETKFRTALANLHMVHQPIVSFAKEEIVAYEALMRSGEPALPHPGAMLEAAEQLGRLPELGRTIRTKVSADATSAPAVDIFVNLHSNDLLDDHLYDAAQAFSGFARRIVLEITERARVDDIKDVSARVARLRAMGFRIAIDDLGAGYAGLTSFAQLKPEFVKLDMSLIRDVHKEGMKQKLIQSLVSTCHDMGIRVVAEGIEHVEERDTLDGLGCDFMQGYLFAKPGKGFPPVVW